MSSELKVDYDILDECIGELKEISDRTGGDEIQKMIEQLSDMFAKSNSDATNALKLRQTEYNRVNNALINLASNGVSVLEKAKILYQNEDILMQTAIAEN